MQEDHSLVRYTLENAAKKLKMPKKSLDDYYLFVRLGRKYKFDFKNNLKAKFGTLRQFVRKAKRANKSYRGEIREEDKNLNNLQWLERVTLTTTTTFVND